jgi:predicted amidohydrolase YtcJ
MTFIRAIRPLQSAHFQAVAVVAVYGALSAVAPIATAAQPADARPADAVYVNANVITLDPQNRTAQALAVRGDKIAAVGDEQTIRKLVGTDTTVHDLAGRTIIPGLYAAHDHFPGAGRIGLFTVDLASPPIGRITNMEELIAALKAKAATTPKGRWVTGRGYDDTLLAERRHPTRTDLDRVSTEHPIWLTHVSGHLGVANSLALAKAKVDRSTPQPAGGRIRTDAAGEPTGVFEESLGFVTRLIPALTPEEQLQATEAAVKQYVRQGVTTAAIAGGSEASLEHLAFAVRRGTIPFRIVTMTSAGPAKAAREAVKELASPHLRTGAIKLLQDGSIQGYTGFLSAPYYKPGEFDSAYRGYRIRSRASLIEKVDELHQAGYQIAIHGNGDAAIDDILDAYEAALAKTPRADARHRIEHCQTVREDQLDRMQKLGITPSFFVGHVYYWGDRHRELFLGPERAARISPLASAQKRGIRFTVHDDTPVTPVNPLQLVWVAANRQTTSGQLLGPEQRITPEQALRAVTIDAAWQNFEEATKGSLEVGKLADFCVLSDNPLTIAPSGYAATTPGNTAPEKIRTITIDQTVVGGKTIYDRNSLR